MPVRVGATIPLAWTQSGHRILLNRAFKFLTLEGSSPVLDDEISKVINQATLVVLMIYDLLAFIAYIGVARIF